MNNSKRLLIIGPLPEPTTGVALANKIVADHFKCDNSITVDVINTSYPKFEEKLGSFSMSKMFFFLRTNMFLYKVIRCDILYLTPGQTFYGIVKYALYILFSKLLGKKLIIHVHGNYIGKEYKQLRGLKKWIYKSLLKKTSKGIVLSESLISNLSPFIPKNDINVVYNFVEDYLFPELDQIKSKATCTKPKIIFLSNLMYEKGIIEFLEACTILEAEGIDYEAKVAGNIDSRNENKIKEYFSKLKSTAYCGVLLGDQKKELLLWGNIFILPTFYEMEGQPISILEAMATGNIILTTQHAGIPDVFIDQKNGYYVEKKNPLDIVNKIKLCRDNTIQSQEIRVENYKSAFKKYRTNNFINNIKKVFQS